MRPGLKLNAIEQEHLQELYDAAGVARDELPYTPAFVQLCEDFQNRTFKNAEPEQVFSALLKYTRSSSNSATDIGPTTLNEEQVKQLKLIVKRHAKAGKLVPYSSEFEGALKDFNNLAGTQLEAHDFWKSICRTQNRSRRPPTRKASAKAAKEDDGGDDDVD